MSDHYAAPCDPTPRPLNENHYLPSVGAIGLAPNWRQKSRALGGFFIYGVPFLKTIVYTDSYNLYFSHLKHTSYKSRKADSRKRFILASTRFPAHLDLTDIMKSSA